MGQGIVKEFDRPLLLLTMSFTSDTGAVLRGMGIRHLYLAECLSQACEWLLQASPASMWEVWPWPPSIGHRAGTAVME